MYRVAAAVAAGRPSVAVFAAGGSIALKEMQENIEQNREMILISGSKGSSDAVAAVHRGAPTSERDLMEISSKGKLTTFALDQKPEFLSLLIADRLLGV
jgi:ABC-type sugar transport system substrate-binding protein